MLALFEPLLNSWQIGVFKLYIIGLLLVAGFCPLQGQSSALGLQLPVVDRLPKWYFEQEPGQVVGISLSASPNVEQLIEAEYEQAICFALIRAALQQSDTNVIRGNVISVSEASADMRNEALRISATLKIPVHYIVLDQCRLKNGTVLVLLQYQYRGLAATEDLEFVYESRISNDSVDEIFVIRNEGKYGFYCQSEYSEYGFFWVLNTERNTPFLYVSSAIPLDIQQYGHVMHNEYLLQNPERYGYIGFMHFDDLRQDLYRKLMYRDIARYETR